MSSSKYRKRDIIRYRSTAVVTRGLFPVQSSRFKYPYVRRLIRARTRNRTYTYYIRPDGDNYVSGPESTRAVTERRSRAGGGGVTGPDAGKRFASPRRRWHVCRTVVVDRARASGQIEIYRRRRRYCRRVYVISPRESEGLYDVT